MKIAFLGLGAMGSHMAAALLDAGYSVTVWNRSEAPARSMTGRGAACANNPQACVRGARVVISMLRDDAASRQVWDASGHNALAALSPGMIVADCSTMSISRIRQLSTAVHATGAEFIDAPVVGSTPQAAAKSIQFLAGGNAAVIDEVRPVLLSMGAAVHHLGPASSGCAFKLVVNTMLATQIILYAEMLALGQSLGLSPDSMLETLVNLPVNSAAGSAAAQDMLSHTYTPRFPIDLAEKDLGYAEEEARRKGITVPLLDTVRQSYRHAVDLGFGEDNISAIARLYE